MHLYIRILQMKHAKMVTHENHLILYTIPKISVRCNTKSAKMVTQTEKRGEICLQTNRLKRKNGNTQ